MQQSSAIFDTTRPAADLREEQGGYGWVDTGQQTMAKTENPLAAKKVTVAAVAEAAGVSAATVSRVLRRRENVDPHLVKIVNDTVTSLGYAHRQRRRRTNQELESTRSGNIALLVSGSDGSRYTLPMMPNLLHGVEREVARRGLNLILASSEGDVPSGVLASGQTDGVLVMGPVPPHPSPLRDQLRELPCVLTFRDYSPADSEFDRVIYDNGRVADVAFDYLRRRDHKVMAFISANPDHEAFTARGEHFLRSAERAGVKAYGLIPKRLELVTDIEFVEKQVAKLLSLNPRPTGLFVASDRHLPTLYYVLTRHGVTPMKDVDIVSVDGDAEIIRDLIPRPASIDINLSLVGAQAVNQLLWRLDNPEMTHRFTTIIEPVLKTE